MLPGGRRGVLRSVADGPVLNVLLWAIVSRAKLLELPHPGDSVVWERGGRSNFVTVRHEVASNWSDSGNPVG